LHRRTAGLCSVAVPERSDLEAIARSGVTALRAGDAAAAREAFDAVVAAGAATPQLKLLQAQACIALGEGAAAERALDGVLADDPRNLFALTMRGDAALGRGDEQSATSFYQLALANRPPDAALSPDLRARLDRAEAHMTAIGGRFRAHLDRALAAVPQPGARFAEAVDILAGEKPIQLQQPTSFYFPQLPQIAFYAREDFAWVAALEAAVPAMRAELEALLATDAGLTPYVQAAPDRASRGHALLNDPRWSAVHLWQDGERTTAAPLAPVTMAALDAVPLPFIAGRSPMALFSVLAAQTHIPRHHGMLNTRLIVHVPLIVPDGCRLRVGNHTRTVEPGKAMIFDDSIEHEAWNDSDAVRVVLLFEIWRPELTEAERRALTAMFEAIATYESAASRLI